MICRAATIERLIDEGMSKRAAELAVLVDNTIPPDDHPPLPCGCCAHCGCSGGHDDCDDWNEEV